MTASVLAAGAASVDITPPLGIHMGGYWGRQSGAVEIGDALQVKALVVGQDGAEVALLAFDLVALDAATTARIRGRIERACGISATGIMLCCSHTHAGPLTVAFRGMGDIDLAYLEKVEECAVKAVQAAQSVMQPVRLAYALPTVQIGHNRRQTQGPGTQIGYNPEGPVVPYAHVVRLEGDTGLVATLFSHACHPVVLGSANHAISAEFCGVAASVIEAQSGAPALFVNGACGDINPRVHGGDFAAVEALGQELAGAVLKGLEEARPVPGAGVGQAVVGAQLPLLDPPPRFQLEAEKWVLQLKGEVKAIARGGGDEWARKVPQAQLEWTRAMLELARNGVQNQIQAFEVQGLRLGGVRLVGMEGEIFSRYQLDLENQVQEPVILCGYANGCIGYVPTANEYERGGYEVDAAYKVYPSVQMIAPSSEAIIRAASAQVLETLGTGR
ncbi:MAG: hypothetical protein GKR89_27255 [Candidatus Latescibacteria bacterium]|nr:hypothetical protein [Candidatus Latescibacterota bacterium]